MTDLDRAATRVSDSVRITLQRLSALIAVVACLAAAIGVATFVTGWWIFDGSRSTWLVVGGLLCTIPVGAALLGLLYVRTTAQHAPELVANVSTLLHESGTTASALIDHDSGHTLSVSARSFASLRKELKQRRRDLPALFVGVRAITSVPGLAAIAVLGMLGVGLLGTILLLGGLID